MIHPDLAAAISTARLADLHAEAQRQRDVRNHTARRDWRFWRRSRPAPPAPVVAVGPADRERAATADTAPAPTELRPVA